MVINADELPREGADGQHIIDMLNSSVGSNNALDVIMKNLPQIARRVGAKPPAVLAPGMGGQPMPPMPPRTPSKQTPTAGALHTPPAVMMPGADTQPGKAVDKESLEMFNKRVSENAALRRGAFGAPPPSGWGAPVTPSYFKDPMGNEYKTVGNALYVLGWQDASVKVRMVNTETGKEIPSKGRKFQIYGWHLVQRVDEMQETPTEAEDISRFEHEVSVERTADTATPPPTAAEPPKPQETAAETDRTDETDTAAETATEATSAAPPSDLSSAKMKKRRLL